MMKKLMLIVVAVMMTATTMATSLTDGLVGYWPFNGDAKDYSGNGNHGTTHGVTLTADRHGNSRCAYNFGEGKYISVSANSQLNTVTDFTLCTWVKADSLDNSCIPILCKGDCHYRLEIADDGLEWVQMQIPPAKSVFSVDCMMDGGSVFSSINISVGKWFHVAVCRKGRRITAYLNGNSVGSSTTAANARMNTSDLEIGKDPPGDMEYLYGAMDDLFLYNRALSSSEISELYHGNLKVLRVKLDANGGQGNMEEETVIAGSDLLLPANKFHNDGFVFQGWALSSSGEVVYKDEAEITVNSDMTLYAVWANPALTLTAESADWSSGSITLRCEDSDTSSSRHRYSLFYYDPSVGFWRIVDSARNIEVDANGKVFLTDAGYSARLDGIPPVQYRVTDENGRMSECETRNRHGLFVAIDLYENRPNIGLVEPPSPTQAAAAFRDAYAKHGDAAGYLWTLENWDAKKNEITNRLDFIAENYSRPGDVFLFYYAGHGFNGGVACYDFEKSLSARELSESFKRFPSGVGVVAIINACCSASMLDMGDVVGNVQVAWIASSQESENTKAGVFDSIVCDRGWLKGGADYCDPTGAVGGDGDGYVTFGELAMWGQQLSGKTYYRYRMLTDLKNSSMLDNIVAGRVPSHASVTPLTDGPSTLTALSGNSGEIRLSWMAVSGASGYDIYRKLRSAMPSTYVYVDTVKGTNTRDGSSYALTPNIEYEYYVRAVNDVYVSDASPTASCAPSENMKIRDYVSRFMSSLSTSSINYSEHPAMVNGEVDYSNLNYDHDGDGMTTFEEYVAGTNPADEADKFVASIKIEDGRPAISWSPNLNTNGSERVYTVWGKTNLYDEVGWTSPTNSGHRFFTVGVEMP